MKSKPVRAYDKEYKLLSGIIDLLTKKWNRKATFADAIRYLANKASFNSKTKKD